MIFVIDVIMGYFSSICNECVLVVCGECHTIYDQSMCEVVIFSAICGIGRSVTYIMLNYYQDEVIEKQLTYLEFSVDYKII